MGSEIAMRTVTNLQLTARGLPSFYHTILALRFPIDVAYVLELRYLLNHAADAYVKPAPSADERQFRKALAAAIDSFGIKNTYHYERLIRILVMIQDLHAAHLRASRIAEISLRNALADIRDTRAKLVRHGLLSLLATIFAGMTWLASNDPGWTIQLLTLILAYLTWDCFRSLPSIDEQPEVLNPALNEVLRSRVESLNWKRLIHKLSLILGYKRIPGLEVFPIDSHA
ncbi:MAG: hypothetical protein O7B27_13400 [Gammaproteobacteria bacterium]|nr:hypothetical protein [Pseudomonadota bacterium]MCZ6733516.1 hypothetical protein [Gammaproteobacteria bacterium]